MNQALFKQSAADIVSLPAEDMLRAVDGAESVINRAVREHGMHAGFPTRVHRGRPVDRLLGIFDGHTVGEAVAVMTELREVLADELARGGAEADVVRDLREGGVRHGPRVVVNERDEK
jgi:hypothetical protein